MSTSNYVPKLSTRGVHEGAPTFFRACCFEAKHGGASSYAHPGWHLAGALGSQIPHDIELHDWADEVETLKDLLADDDGEGVWKCFKQHYPRCFALIPSRRRDQFIEGVRRAFEEGRVEV